MTMSSFLPLICIQLILLNSARLPASDSSKLCLHPVKNEGKWGYADFDGNDVIPCSFDSALSFSEGLAAIEVNTEWGFIDQKGKIVISPRFCKVESFSCSLAKIWTKNPIYPVAFIDTEGKVAFSWKQLEITSFYFDRALVYIHDKVCFLNRKGRIVIRTSFPYGGIFYEGIALVWTGHSAKFIDTNGRRIAYFYEMGHFNFSEGAASVLGNGHRYYINSAGKKIRISSRTFYIDKSGNPVLTNTVDSLVYFPFSDGMAEVCIPGTGHKSGYIDSTGKLLIPIIYDEASPFSKGYATVRRAEKSYIIDKKGDVIEVKDRSKFYRRCACQ